MYAIYQHICSYLKVAFTLEVLKNIESGQKARVGRDT